jgi:hypothetical protein
MSGVELLKKLVPLVPPTYANLTRFHGVFAPTSRLRAKVVPPPPTKSSRQSQPSSSSSSSFPVTAPVTTQRPPVERSSYRLDGRRSSSGSSLST